LNLLFDNVAKNLEHRGSVAVGALFLGRIPVWEGNGHFNQGTKRMIE